MGVIGESRPRGGRPSAPNNLVRETKEPGVRSFSKGKYFSNQSDESPRSDCLSSSSGWYERGYAFVFGFLRWWFNFGVAGEVPLCCLNFLCCLISAVVDQYTGVGNELRFNVSGNLPLGIELWLLD